MASLMKTDQCLGRQYKEILRIGPDRVAGLLLKLPAASLSAVSAVCGGHPGYMR